MRRKKAGKGPKGDEEGQEEEVPHLYVKLHEACSLPHDRIGFMWVTMSLDEHDVSSSYVRAGETVQWDEEFVFHVQQSISCLEVKLWMCDESAKANQFCGEVNIPLSTLKAQKVHHERHEWRGVNNDAGDPHICGTVTMTLFNTRPRSTLDNLRDLESVYPPFFAVLAEPPFHALSALFDVVDSTDSDKMCTSIARIFSWMDKEFELFDWIIGKEVHYTVSTTVLFRSASMAVRLVGAYSRTVCKQYLIDVLTPLFDAVFSDPSGFEVDPSRIPANAAPNAVQENASRLLQVTESTFKRIIRSADRLPIEIRQICQTFGRYVDDVFPGFTPKAIGGFFFLRLVCPCICAPHAFGILNTTTPKPLHVRALVLVAKVLQNLSNQTCFHEPFMAPFNIWLEHSYHFLADFFLHISQPFPTRGGTAAGGDDDVVVGVRGKKGEQAGVILSDAQHVAKLCNAYYERMVMSAEEGVGDDERNRATGAGGSRTMLQCLDHLKQQLTLLQEQQVDTERPYTAFFGPELLQRGAMKVTRMDEDGGLHDEDDDDTGVLNAHVYVDMGNAKPGIDRHLLSTIHALYVSAAQSAKKVKNIPWSSVHKSTAFAHFEESICDLQGVALQGMSNAHKVAFWVNVYNTLMIHLHVILGAPTNTFSRKAFYNHHKYRIGRCNYSLNDIFHGILRGNAAKPTDRRHQWFKDNDHRRAFVLPLEPLVHFMCSSLTVSSPFVFEYHPNMLDTQMKAATAQYLEQHVFVDAPRKEVTLPRLFHKYAVDFPTDMRELALWIADYADIRMKMDFLHLRERNFEVRYRKASTKLHAIADTIRYAKVRLSDHKDVAPLPEILTMEQQKSPVSPRLRTGLRSRRLIRSEHPAARKKRPGEAIPRKGRTHSACDDDEAFAVRPRSGAESPSSPVSPRARREAMDTPPPTARSPRSPRSHVRSPDRARRQQAHRSLSSGAMKRALRARDDEADYRDSERRELRKLELRKQQQRAMARQDSGMSLIPPAKSDASKVRTSLSRMASMRSVLTAQHQQQHQQRQSPQHQVQQRNAMQQPHSKDAPDMSNILKSIEQVYATIGVDFTPEPIRNSDSSERDSVGTMTDDDDSDNVMRRSLANISRAVMTEIYDVQFLTNQVLNQVNKTLSVTVAFETGKAIRRIKLELLAHQGPGFTALLERTKRSSNAVEPPKMTDYQERILSATKQKQLLKLLVAIQAAVRDITFILEDMTWSMKREQLLYASQLTGKVKKEMQLLLDKVKRQNKDVNERHSETIQVVQLRMGLEPELAPVRTTIMDIQNVMQLFEMDTKEGQLSILRFANLLTFVKKQLDAKALLPPFAEREFNYTYTQGMEAKFHGIKALAGKLILELGDRFQRLATELHQLKHSELLLCYQKIQSIKDALFTRPRR